MLETQGRRITDTEWGILGLKEASGNQDEVHVEVLRKFNCQDRKLDSIVLTREVGRGYFEASKFWRIDL